MSPGATSGVDEEEESSVFLSGERDREGVLDSDIKKMGNRGARCKEGIWHGTRLKYLTSHLIKHDNEARHAFNMRTDPYSWDREPKR